MVWWRASYFESNCSQIRLALRRQLQSLNQFCFGVYNFPIEWEERGQVKTVIYNFIYGIAILTEQHWNVAKVLIKSQLFLLSKKLYQRKKKLKVGKSCFCAFICIKSMHYVIALYVVVAEYIVKNTRYVWRRQLECVIYYLFIHKYAPKCI